MLMLRNNKNKIRKKFQIKKSQILLFGSLLIFIGLVTLSWNALMHIRSELYSDMMINFSDMEKKVKEVPVTDEVKASPQPAADGTVYDQGNINYGKYLGVLYIPKIGLRRGFFDTNNRYNSIEYNVTMLPGSSTPDIQNGNLMLIAHSGTAYISYFAFLYRLNVGDPCYITYNGYDYKYKIVNIYNVPKVGNVQIVRNFDKTTLTLITCTKDNDTMQTVYIAEME